MATFLADLLTAKTQAEIFAILLEEYQAAGFPVTAWQEGGTERTRLMAVAKALADVSGNYVPAIAGGSLLDYSVKYPGWTALTAQQIYNLTQNAATFTTGTLVANNASAGSYSYSPSSPLKFTFAASQRSYLSTGSGTIAGSGNTSVPVIAEFAGSAYIEPSNSAGITLTTPLPGVTVTNPAGTFSTVTHGGSGTGTLTLGGSPVGPHTVVVTILSTGQAGVATWQYTLDGSSVIVGAAALVTNIGGTGINITLTNGTINPSFVDGDVYSFTAPGSWITTQGGNLEADPALADRCRNRWASLANAPTQSLYELLATSTPSVGSQVTQVFVSPDQFINNKVNVFVAGPAGVLPSATITAIQNYITPRARGCDNPVVQSPATLAITLAGTVTVSLTQLSNAQAAITTALQNYIASIPINGTIRIASIIKLIDQVDGVIDVTGVTINGGSSNLTLGGSGVYALPAYPPIINLTYVGQ